jgi:hypothetical protein
MARSPFGLTLTNRAVVLGVIKARDLIDLTVTAEASGAFGPCGSVTACWPSPGWSR